ncbi:hypothetical protein ACOWPH_21195 [Anabaena sp. PCC 7938]|uniref:hypothetical protein n=1 Tax=Anabaena TaxID=1163 RepID=UPI00030A40C3|nr:MULTISPECIES: hypothetical protein [Anabaena]MCM2406749.1 hypothetical protein [Anabaena sp. CCAP 1446/1C]
MSQQSVHHNEAFALSNVLFNRLLGVPEEKLKVFGGAIALGHPLVVCQELIDG